MEQVTEKEFFARLYADARDIMPSNRLDYETRWETKARVLWGVSKPGWKNSGNPNDPKSYFIVKP